MSDKVRKEIANRQDAKAKALTPAEPRLKVILEKDAPRPPDVAAKEPSGAEG